MKLNNKDTEYYLILPDLPQYDDIRGKKALIVTSAYIENRDSFIIKNSFNGDELVIKRDGED